LDPKEHNIEECGATRFLAERVNDTPPALQPLVGYMLVISGVARYVKVPPLPTIFAS
jgi:hypothetical protein